MNSQFQINTITGRPLRNPSITALKNNNFVISWDDGYGMYAVIFTDNGTKVISKLNLIASSVFSYSSLTTLANSNFLVAYRCNPNICAQIFYSSGTMLKSEIMVNTFIIKNNSASIGSMSNSNLMIVWISQYQDIIGGTDWGIYGQSFTSSGAKIGNEFRVNTHILDDQNYPSIVSLANDNYIVTWQSNNQDSSGWGIYGQILDSYGNKIGNEFRVNTYTLSNQMYPSVSSLINTNFVVVWQSVSQDGSGYGIFGNIYQSDGSIVGFNECPFNCQSCTNSTNCITCDPNFKSQPNGLCGCFDGFYLVNISGYDCISNFIILN